MITAIIVDDESSARSSLKTMLAEKIPALHIVTEAANVSEAVKAIHTHNPDIVFLDIEMPGQFGFQLFDYIDKPDFEVIFITALSSFALQAFEVSAIGYLLKPVNADALVSVVEKAILLRQQAQFGQRLEVLKQNMAEPQLKKLALPVADGFIFISPEEILYFEADGAYTKVFLQNEKEILISKKLLYFEKLLASNTLFFRSHRSYLININFIKAYVKADGGYIVMKNDHHVSLAKERLDEFNQFIISNKN